MTAWLAVLTHNHITTMTDAAVKAESKSAPMDYNALLQEFVTTENVRQIQNPALQQLLLWIVQGQFPYIFKTGVSQTNYSATLKLLDTNFQQQPAFKISLLCNFDVIRNLLSRILKANHFTYVNTDNHTIGVYVSADSHFHVFDPNKYFSEFSTLEKAIGAVVDTFVGQIREERVDLLVNFHVFNVAKPIHDEKQRALSFPDSVSLLQSCLHIYQNKVNKQVGKINLLMFLVRQFENELLKVALQASVSVAGDAKSEFLVDPEQSIEGITPLMVAANVNNPEAIGLLRQRGVNVEAKNLQGKTAIDIARQRGHKDCVAVLESKRAFPPLAQVQVEAIADDVIFGVGSAYSATPSTSHFYGTSDDSRGSSVSSAVNRASLMPSPPTEQKQLTAADSQDYPTDEQPNTSCCQIL